MKNISYKFLWVASVLLYIMAPESYSQQFNIIVFSVFLLTAFKFLKHTSNGNYFNFHSIFFVSFMYTNFMYAVFYHPFETNVLGYNRKTFSDDIINSCTALSYLGYASYVLGVMEFYKQISQIRINMKAVYSHFFIIISGLLFLVFIFTVDKDFLMGYNVGISYWSGIAIYTYTLLGITLSIAVIFEIFRISNIGVNGMIDFFKKINKFFILLIVLFLFIVLRSGERGIPLQIIVLSIGLYSLLIKKMTKALFIGLISSGVIFFTLISYYRTSDLTDDTSGRFSKVASNTEDVNFGVDLIVVNRNLYLAYEYVGNNSVSYGRTMTLQFFRFLPVFPTYIYTVQNLSMNELDSVYFFNSLTYGSAGNTEQKAGTGSQLIADVYLSFGSIGVVFFMYFLGRMITKFYNSGLMGNYNNFLSYAILLSFAHYFPRSGFMYLMQPIIWICVCFYLYRIFYLKKYII